MKIGEIGGYFCEIEFKWEALLVLNIQVFVLLNEILLFFAQNIDLFLRNDSIILPKSFLDFYHSVVAKSVNFHLETI